MANNSLGTETPQSAPDIDPGNVLRSGPAPGGPMPGAGPGMPPQAAGGAAAEPPAISPAQTMAALRHFDAVRKEMEIIVGDPALGKTSVKSKIIDGMTRLVSARFLKPAQAVDELAKVPKEPLMQLKWAKGMLEQASTAENAILDHYGMGNPHLGSVDDHFGASVAPNHDEHGSHIEALMGSLKKPSA